MWTINTSFLSKNEVLTGNKTAGAVKQKKVYGNTAQTQTKDNKAFTFVI